MRAEATTSLPSIQGIDRSAIRRSAPSSVSAASARIGSENARTRRPRPVSACAISSACSGSSSSTKIVFTTSSVTLDVHRSNARAACRARFGTHLAICTSKEVQTETRCPSIPQRRVRRRTPDAPKRTWLVYLLLGLFAAMLFSRSGPTGNRISYSDFKQQLASGQISEVEIGKERIRATPSDEKAKKHGDRWVTMRVDDPDLVKQLEAKKVAFGGHAGGRLAARRCSWCGCCRCCCSAASGCSCSAA